LPSPGIDNLLRTPRTGKLEPGPDGFTAGLEDGEETDQPPPIAHRSAKKKVRQKPDIAERSSAIQSLGDQTDVERLKPNLTICRGC
jgi:hypothetical protein